MTTSCLRLRALVAVLLAVGLGSLTACSTTLGDLPLPGTGVSGDTIRVDAEFQEALNLAQGATVKVNGIDSGKVQDVFVEDFHARAEMLVRTDAVLRAGATARLRYTTPLGELFVDVTNPSEGPTLADGALITLEDSSTAPTVEDALSQASLLVNGGGLGDLQTVTEELNTVLGGREDTARSLLERSRDFLVEANATTQDIDRALRSLVSVSSTLQQRERIINRAVREIEPAAAVLRRNTPGLTTLLQQVERFSGAAEETVARPSCACSTRRLRCWPSSPATGRRTRCPWTLSSSSATPSTGSCPATTSRSRSPYDSTGSVPPTSPASSSSWGSTSPTSRTCRSCRCPVCPSSTCREVFSTG